MLKAIAFPEQIYKNGGYYDFTPAYEYIDISDNGAKLVGELYSSSSLVRTIANLKSHDEGFLKTINDLYSVINLGHTECAASHIIQLNDVIIHDNIFYVKNNDEYHEFYYSSRPNDAPHAKHLSKVDLDNIPQRKIVTKNTELVYIGSVGGFNYGHFLIDDLAKIKYISQTKHHITILIQSYGKIDSVKTDAIKAYCGNNISFKFISSGEVVRCENLTYITPISFHPYTKNTHALKYIHDIGREKFADPSAQRRRLFINRNSRNLRTISNMKDIKKILKSYDFDIIESEKHSFKRQAKIFSEADCVVGVMGAAMCNTIFTQCGVKILYLAPNEWMEPFYWDLASALGHEYSVIYGNRTFKNEHAHFDDFTIDLEIFEEEIKRITA